MAGKAIREALRDDVGLAIPKPVAPSNRCRLIMVSARLWRLVIVVMLIIMLGFAARMCKEHSPNRGDAKLKDVETLFAAVPIYPGSREIRTSWSSKDRVAGLGKVYKSDASYEELRHYYVDVLAQVGWHLEHERHVTSWWQDLGGRELRFRQDDYYTSIEYAGERANYGWDYGISLGWRSL